MFYFTVKTYEILYDKRIPMQQQGWCCVGIEPVGGSDAEPAIWELPLIKGVACFFLTI